MEEIKSGLELIFGDLSIRVEQTIYKDTSLMATYDLYHDVSQTISNVHENLEDNIKSEIILIN